MTDDRSQPTADRWVIELTLDNKHDADLAYDAIGKLRVEMGEIGTLCIWRHTRNWIGECADAKAPT